MAFFQTCVTYNLSNGQLRQNPRALIDADGSGKTCGSLNKVISTSWQNTEEEEFDWKDMHALRPCPLKNPVMNPSESINVGVENNDISKRNLMHQLPNQPAGISSILTRKYLFLHFNFWYCILVFVSFPSWPRPLPLHISIANTATATTTTTATSAVSFRLRNCGVSETEKKYKKVGGKRGATVLSDGDKNDKLPSATLSVQQYLSLSRIWQTF
ncbi:hypothetical protein P8452_58141 [Trifolium repens]|nr:hypothetical protein P8452_58141 [Trifolium repens]